MQEPAHPPEIAPESKPPNLRLAKLLQFLAPLIMIALTIMLEVIEELHSTHSHFGAGGPHEGFYLEIFVYGFLGPFIIGGGFFWVAKIIEQLESARASEEKLRHELEAQAEVRQKLLAKTVQIQESERQRIARELHDGIGQPLTSFLFTSAEKEVESDYPALKHARRAATDTLESMRQLILDLRPSLLDARGLLPALRQCADNTLTPANIQVQFTAVGQSQPISDEVKTALFRIGQESFTNILRHAQATCAEVQLTYRPSEIQLTIADNGKGFESNCKSTQIQSLGLGLLSMRERLEQVDGRLQVDSSPGTGTRITAVIPLTCTNGSIS